MGTSILRSKIQRTTILLFVALLARTTNGSHLMGSEIFYTSLGGLDYRITVHLYFKPDAIILIPECDLEIDGTSFLLPLDTTIDHGGYGLAEALFHIDHSFPGPGTYVLRSSTQYRSGAILNIPGSQNVWSCVETRLVIAPGMAPNNSVVFNEPQPPYYIPPFQIYTHDPDPSDPDGDSLAFEMVTPGQYQCDPIINYTRPGDIPSGFQDTVETFTGHYVWDSPQIIGAYSMALRCSEYRNGALIGQVTRDMTMVVGPVSAIDDGPASGGLVLLPTARPNVFAFASAPTGNVTIRDVKGMIVRDLGARQASGELDLDPLASGLYIVTFGNAAGPSAQKVHVVH